MCLFLLNESCNNSNLIKPYEFSGGWKANEVVEFSFDVSESSSDYNAFLILRHNKNYAFSNIFLITNIVFENQYSKTDTLEYILSKKNGEWLGEKKLSIVEHKLLFKKNLNLIKDSIYKISIRNSMRLNNEVNPITNLNNVIDLGLLIEIED
jgi:gliding motility-associated lipoprotein GldH